MLSRYKYDLIHIGITLVIFFTAFFIKLDNLKAPLVRHQEWISAHTLITAEIWDQNNGPSYSGFSPVYTYPNKSNFGRKMLGGVTNSKGHHYVSYPPFSFIFGYYGMQIFGGVNPYNLRAISLTVGLLSALLLMFIIRNFHNEKRIISVPAIIGVGFYVFSTGNMLYFGHLYFADVLIVLFTLLLFYLFQKHWNNDDLKPNLLLIGVFIFSFLGVYTEWLGAFLSFSIGMVMILRYFKYKDLLDLKVFITTALGSILAVIVTIVQYSNIKSWEILKEAWIDKFAVRSGSGLLEHPQNEEFTIKDTSSYEMLYSHLKGDLIGLKDYFFIILGLLLVLVLFKGFRLNLYQFKRRLLVPLVFLFAVLIHYIVFFNFNTIHTFSSIKLTIALVLVMTFILTIIWESFTFKIILPLRIAIGVVAILFIYQEVRRYNKLYNENTLNRNLYLSRTIIGSELNPDVYIFTNLPNCPEQIYCVKQDVFPADNRERVLQLMDALFVDRAYFYNSENSRLTERIYFERKGNEVEESKRSYNWEN